MDIEIRGRKILLIGNGFDLAHGLPTSYSYFLDFCDKVSRIFTYLMYVDQKVYEKSALNIWDVDDSIKAKLLEWYKKRNENPDKLAVEIYNNIKENIWIHYFLNIRYSLGKNWIDFESEISNVVQAIETLKGYIERDEDVLKIKDTKQKTIIYFLKIAKKSLQDVFNLKRIDGFIEDISIELDKLIRSLEIYICEFVNEIDIIKENDDIKTITPDYVLSFNYSNTYERIYGQSKEVTYDYIHGKADIENNVDTCNLVLGIDEYLEDDKNDKLEFIAFKKFYQRIYKSTDSTYMKWVEQIKKYPEVNHNLFIFGHSLDKTDRDILKLLICNDNVTTKIYYYRKNKNDKKELGKLIKNLVRIMGQDELISRTMGEHKTIEFIPQTVFVAKNN